MQPVERAEVVPKRVVIVKGMNTDVGSDPAENDIGGEQQALFPALKRQKSRGMSRGHHGFESTAAVSQLVAVIEIAVSHKPLARAGSFAGHLAQLVDQFLGDAVFPQVTLRFAEELFSRFARRDELRFGSFHQDRGSAAPAQFRSRANVVSMHMRHDDLPYVFKSPAQRRQRLRKDLERFIRLDAAIDKQQTVLLLEQIHIHDGQLPWQRQAHQPY